MLILELLEWELGNECYGGRIVTFAQRFTLAFLVTTRHIAS